MPQTTIRERNLELIASAQNGDENAEALLIKENAGLVRSVMRRFSGRGTDDEDLFQIGTIGMLRAIRSFSLESGNAFSTYAIPLVLGEIRRHFRDTGPVKVSRIYKQNGLRLARARKTFEAENGREPTLSELAKLCSMDREEAAMALQSASPISSFSDPVAGDEGLTYEGVLADEDSRRELERTLDCLAVSQSLSKMPKEWRRIVLLRYYRNLTQRETASIMGLTQVKISREEKKILDFLRKELT